MIIPGFFRINYCEKSAMNNDNFLMRSKKIFKMAQLLLYSLMSWNIFKPLKKYTFDIDSDPSVRWKNVINEHRENIKKFITYCDDVLDPIIKPASWLAYLYSNMMHYVEDLKYISEIVDVTLSKIVLIQFIYEQILSGISIIVDKDDESYHYRTIDHKTPELKYIKNMLIVIEFRKNNEIIYTGVCVAGYVGVLMGVMKNIATLSLDKKNIIDPITNSLNLMVSGYWLPGFLIRHIMETSKTYDQIIIELTNSMLISNCIISINGNSLGTGQIIVRGKNKLLNIIKMSKNYMILQNCAETEHRENNYHEYVTSCFVVIDEQDNNLDNNLDSNFLQKENINSDLNSDPNNDKKEEIIKNIKNIYLPNAHHLMKIISKYPITNNETLVTIVANCDTCEIITSQYEDLS